MFRDLGKYCGRENIVETRLVTSSHVNDAMLGRLRAHYFFLPFPPGFQTSPVLIWLLGPRLQCKHTSFRFKLLFVVVRSISVDVETSGTHARLLQLASDCFSVNGMPLTEADNDKRQGHLQPATNPAQSRNSAHNPSQLEQT